ncbi:palmitoyltransferase ZDHHC1 isoform X2 [Protopterus annectens]|uniref:palmitoyltransferase ZDHHC1 isoform X2 n=1 Tax=Protopterus annectens TaxID=7888 RepID=UPI001CFB3C49|nr:palmitoyltransferase ZDHHC1 isoform X2 [Protopterus annectens]
MSFCSKNLNKIVPQEGAATSKDYSQHFRVNGWSWPPHPLQILAWAAYMFLAVTGFGVFVPLLPHHWVPAGYICTGVMFACHLIVHLSAVTINPAVKNVRMKSFRGPVPVFDRSKHAHVIENNHCGLCNVFVSSKAKHCGACNKCVSDFDHHCKWLNNCVGSRNYWFFLNSVITAVLGATLVSIIALYVLIEYFNDPRLLRSDSHFEVTENNTDIWYVFLPGAPVQTAGYSIVVLASVTLVLGLLFIAFLGHLLCFHIYLRWNRLSTYEYIRRQHHRQQLKEKEKDRIINESVPPKQRPSQDAPYPGSLGYTNPDVQVEDSSAATTSGKDFPKLYANGALKMSADKQEEDLEPDISLDQQQTEPRKASQKRKKAVHRIPGESKTVHGIPGDPDNVRIFNSRSHHVIPALQSEHLATSQNVIPIPAFPQRTLPPNSLAQAGSVQAAGPPAEYHSDSAESMEEIPVVQTRLGSAAMVNYSSPVYHGSKTVVGDSFQSLVYGPYLSSECMQQPSPTFFMKKKNSRRHSSMDQRFELISKPPSVYVSKSSGELADLESVLNPRVRDVYSQQKVKRTTHWY